ncbi:23S rRNA (pseudouridine(1915)-N(3))-methyltransferase RlmH [Marinilabilia rubra]|uniref:Ribosomal RNA large subunit methyltransferase H n=1 Tax=Marinilabilia rubra TaxID=2162893 RepID=A0A2U2B4G3_9BACT|nr:23S rRNA (pseudouridine(1915)-N(3))-methyltransferase RlmH [Marinilabilia rubra]PWD97949.1 23S rRNA (pseudouridine(1915)-N(3))-methyltransferase RlmH [Marinilabilia rubra]
MKVLLLMVGKTSEKWLNEGVESYYKRLNHYLPFDAKVLPDIKNAGKIKPEALKQLEGEAILKVLDKSDRLILLDEGGKHFSSRDFAGFMEKQMLAGTRRLVFVIGGAWGFSDEVYKHSNSKISLSRMTFSHQMVRLIFAEQLYRAMTILKNEPYHHD